MWRLILGLALLMGLYSQADAAAADVTLTTDDQVRIRATVTTPADARGRLAAVVLIHQGGSNRHEWTGMTGKLVERGYLVIAYDIRGHGDSDPVRSIRKLFDDPDLAPRDLSAVLHFLRERADVDPNRIGVVGASIGANLAAMASSTMHIKTAVAISGKTAAVYHLAGTDSLSMKSVFYIASAGDQHGKRAEWARELYRRTAAPRRLEIVPDSNRHGVHIFEDSPATEEHILQWLGETL